MELLKEGGLEMLTKDVLIGPNHDPIFKSLAQLNVVENYLRRTVAVKTEQGSSEFTLRAPEGDERDEDVMRKKKLVSAFILKHQEDIKSHSSGGPITYDEINLSELPAKVIKESKSHFDENGKWHPYKDGAYIIKCLGGGMIGISNKRHIHNYITKSLTEYNARTRIGLDDFWDISKMLVPQDFSDSDGFSLEIGTKTQMGIAAGDSYLIKQTAYGGIDVGKVVKVGKMLEGVAAEFFLYKVPDSELHRYAGLKDDDFFNPKEKVVGILRTYAPGLDKSVRNEYVVTPKELGVEEDVKQFFPVEASLRKKPLQEVYSVAQV